MTVVKAGRGAVTGRVVMSIKRSQSQSQSHQRVKVVLEAHPGNYSSILITALTCFVQLFSSCCNSQNMLQQYNTHIPKLHVILNFFS